MTIAEILSQVIVGGVSFRTQVLAVGASIVLLGVVVHLIRSEKLKPGYSIGWFAVGLAMVLFALFTPLLNVFAGLLGISYPPAAFLLLLVGGLFALALHYSVMVSQHDKKIRELAQEHALLRTELTQPKQSEEMTSGIVIERHESVKEQTSV